MPEWLQTIVYASVGSAALIGLFKTVVVPAFRFLKNAVNAFNVLNEIVEQFHSDSGTSLRDVVNRLEVAAETNRLALEGLTKGAVVVADNLEAKEANGKV